MPSPGLGGSSETAYVPVPEAKPFILFQWWAREIFFFSVLLLCFFPPWTYAGFSPPFHLQTWLLSLYRQPACCDLWVSTVRGSQTGKFPVYTRIPWKMSLVNLFLSLTSSNCAIIFLKPTTLPFTNPEKLNMPLFCFRRAQVHPSTSCEQKHVVETYCWNLCKELLFVYLFVCFLTWKWRVEVLDPNVSISDLFVWVVLLLCTAETCGFAAHWFYGSRVQGCLYYKCCSNMYQKTTFVRQMGDDNSSLFNNSVKV